MINFAVGPVMMDTEIIQSASQQLRYFRTDEFSTLMLENEDLLKAAIKASSNSRIVFLTGSGTAAMEATVINVFTDKDKLLVVNGGTFGNRFADICAKHYYQYTEIMLQSGEALEEKHLEPHSGKGYTGLLVNIHETSTGVLYNIDLISLYCAKHGLILVVDAISAFLADEYDMAGNRINVSILSSQKALALPPGLSMIVLDEIAQERVRNNTVDCLYFDLIDYLKDGVRGQTPYTPAVSLLLQLNWRLRQIDQRGVQTEIQKVKKLAKHFRENIVGLPLRIAFSNNSNALTPITPKGKMKAAEIFKYLKETYDIYVCPNGGELKDIVFRVGHIGALTEYDNETLIEAFQVMNRMSIL